MTQYDTIVGPVAHATGGSFNRFCVDTHVEFFSFEDLDDELDSIIVNPLDNPGLEPD